MGALSDYMFDNFLSKMITHLRVKFPERTKSVNDERIRHFIRRSVEKANSFNIHKGRNLETFLECTLVYGLDFQGKPDYDWAKTILEDDGMDETEKMNRINEYRVFGAG